MPKVTYLANQLFASDTINVSCSEGNYTLNARIPVELSNEAVFALFKESQLFLDTVSANSIVIEDYKEPDEETINKKKLTNLIKLIEEGVTFESLYTAIDFKVRDKLSTYIAEEMAKQILPKILGQNILQPVTSTSEESVESPPTDDKPPESPKTATTKTAKS